MVSLQKTWLWGLGKRFAADPTRRMCARICNRGRIPVGYCDLQNWGDALNPVLVEHLSGRKAQHLESPFYERYLVVGSVLGSANSRARVWGSGFIRQGETVIDKPRAIYAVRGPLSRAALLNAGIACPAVYGDPALLLPRFFNPEVAKRYTVGIIPHYVDKGHPWLARYRGDHRVLIINIEGRIRDFVREVKSCDVILSSSLHGLICADAYGVPNAWVRFSDKVIGGDFKFRDYSQSICAGEPHAIEISKDTNLTHAVGKVAHHDLAIDLRKLILSCPFLCDSLRRNIEISYATTCGLPDRLPSGWLEEGE